MNCRWYIEELAALKVVTSFGIGKVFPERPQREPINQLNRQNRSSLNAGFNESRFRNWQAVPPRPE
jgi:hypothetical protein